MSLSNSIVNPLNIKDKNIKLSEGISSVLIKGVLSHLVNGTLSFTPTHCLACGLIFYDKVIKHGFKTARIKLLKCSEGNPYLDLKKQRYRCGHSLKTFTLKTPLVNDNCYISNLVKTAIIK